jgi:UDP-3-O-acyl N-acetylglucosamine deacetylase
METYLWPENIKGLKNLVDRLVVSGTGEVVTISDLPEEIGGVAEEEPQGRAGVQHLENVEWEKESISQLLGAHQGNLRRIASQLGISEGQLGKKIKAYGLDRIPRAQDQGIVPRTLGKSVLLSGQGLHSGLKTGLILSPLPPGSGIIIGNLTSEEFVRAHLDNVISTDSATTIQQGTMTVRTIEHLMAVLHAYGICNVLIKVAEEIPIMDGSAKEFCRLIEDAGVVEQEGFVKPIEVSSSIGVTIKRSGGEPVTLQIEPNADFVIDFQMVMPEPIGVQRFTFTLDHPESFRDAIAPARTFGRIKDVETQGKRGLVGGGRLDNVILLDEGRVVNTQLRYPDEFVRHKILDIIGDLYLLGRPVRGKVTARMSGHTENIKLLRKLQTQ